MLSEIQHRGGTGETLTFSLKNTFSFSIIFQHEIVGEFWYKLNLLAKEPEPKYLPAIDSELGRFVTLFS